MKSGKSLVPVDKIAYFLSSWDLLAIKCCGSISKYFYSAQEELFSNMQIAVIQRLTQMWQIKTFLLLLISSQTIVSLFVLFQQTV